MTVQEMRERLLAIETINEVVGLAAALITAAQENVNGPSEVRLFLERVVELANELE